MKADTPSRFINRELSWLEFNHRVLAEARDPANRPLDRLKFLAITASNLDEFFMVRVGGLQQLVAQQITTPDPAGLPPAEQLRRIRDRVRRLVAEQYACFGDLETVLAEHGWRRLTWNTLGDRHIQFAEYKFEHELLPLLTPRAIEADRPFPLLPHLSLCLGVLLKPCHRPRRKPRVVVVPLPRNIPRFVPLESEQGLAYLALEELVRANLTRLFPGEELCGDMLFRLTRNADLAVREDQAGDLLDQMRRVLDQRRQSPCVRLEITGAAPPALQAFLQTALDISETEIYSVPGPLALDDFFALATAPGWDALRAPPWEPRQPPAFAPGVSVFETLGRQDVILHHPYESFEPVQRLVQEAAADPDVLAIKQILYRTSPDSPIVETLGRAAENGKQVTVIVELKARFDEARNIGWARALEQAGAQVIYGIKGLKTHAKLCLIVRREPTGIRRYLHFGTGNYNEVTARLYTDVSFLTCREDLAADASRFFNTITGYAQPAKYQKLDAAPLGLRERLGELIENEALRAKQGQPGHIMAKLNALADPALIETLYAASAAGVRIELAIRGICCLRPGVPGLSENISVVSVVDRFLEHSRILYFRHGGDPLVFISSADWMPRNLDRRIELLVPVEDEQCRRRLIADLTTCLADTVKGWVLLPDGSYQRRTATSDPLRSQEALYRQACERERQATAAGTVFQPHRPSGLKI